ncbi:hypothetical protein EV182_001508 [Spiromyces aspiralis]|uniref:Uncharacterized protein n=1 Tax=Spiromyces aspiralis TaxID=68401 RepID=A0ACC1HFH8_9FUNG|nr:hypothetical protein EV182_001508 [Spiromyces aspiralis]
MLFWTIVIVPLLAIILHTQTNYLKPLQDLVFVTIYKRLLPGQEEGLAEVKTSLFQDLGNRVLELGPGPVPALTYAKDTSDVEAYVVLEPNSHMYSDLADVAAKYGFMASFVPALDTANSDSRNAAAGEDQARPLTVVEGTLDSNAVPLAVSANAPYDTVISSLVLCSVRDMQRTLDHIQSLLKPGGRFIFLEHVRHNTRRQPNKAWWARFQSAISPVWSFFLGNCHLDRPTDVVIQNMNGWSEVDVKYHKPKSNTMWNSLIPMVYGYAIKA